MQRKQRSGPEMRPLRDKLCKRRSKYNQKRFPEQREYTKELQSFSSFDQGAISVQGKLWRGRCIAKLWYIFQYILICIWIKFHLWEVRLSVEIVETEAWRVEYRIERHLGARQNGSLCPLGCLPPLSIQFLVICAFLRRGNFELLFNPRIF